MKKVPKKAKSISIKANIKQSLKPKPKKSKKESPQKKISPQIKSKKINHQLLASSTNTRKPIKVNKNCKRDKRAQVDQEENSHAQQRVQNIGSIAQIGSTEQKLIKQQKNFKSMKESNLVSHKNINEGLEQNLYPSNNNFNEKLINKSKVNQKLNRNSDDIFIITQKNKKQDSEPIPNQQNFTRAAQINELTHFSKEYDDIFDVLIPLDEIDDHHMNNNLEVQYWKLLSTKNINQNLKKK